MPLGGALVSGGVSLLGGFLGSSAASKAAKQLNQTGQAVAGQIDKSTADAVNAGYAGITESNDAINSGTAAANKDISDAGTAQQGIYGTETAAINPYQNAGLVGLDKLQSSAGTFSYNPSDLESDPGYLFQLKEGEKALQNSAAARGMLQSGATLKSLDQYSQGLAGTSYQNAYNRALTTYNANQQGLQSLANLGTTANSQQLQAGSTYGGQLTSLANLGANTNMQGAGLLSNTAIQGNQYVGTTGLAGAEASGNARMQGAGAAAAGTIGAANAWSSALSGVGKAATTYGLSQMAAPMPTGSGGQAW